MSENNPAFKSSGNATKIKITFLSGNSRQAQRNHMALPFDFLWIHVISGIKYERTSLLSGLFSWLTSTDEFWYKTKTKSIVLTRNLSCEIRVNEPRRETQQTKYRTQHGISINYNKSWRTKYRNKTLVANNKMRNKEIVNFFNLTEMNVAIFGTSIETKLSRNFTAC